MEKFDDEVDVGKDHASAAVPLATKLIKGIPIKSYEMSIHARQRLECKIAVFSNTYEVDTFSLPIRSKYLFHLLPTTYKPFELITNSEY